MQSRDKRWWHILHQEILWKESWTDVGGIKKCGATFWLEIIRKQIWLTTIKGLISLNLQLSPFLPLCNYQPKYKLIAVVLLHGNVVDQPVNEWAWVAFPTPGKMLKMLNSQNRVPINQHRLTVNITDTGWLASQVCPSLVSTAPCFHSYSCSEGRDTEMQWGGTGPVILGPGDPSTS